MNKKSTRAISSHVADVIKDIKSPVTIRSAVRIGTKTYGNLTDACVHEAITIIEGSKASTSDTLPTIKNNNLLVIPYLENVAVRINRNSKKRLQESLAKRKLEQGGAPGYKVKKVGEVEVHEIIRVGDEPVIKHEPKRQEKESNENVTLPKLPAYDPMAPENVERRKAAIAKANLHHSAEKDALLMEIHKRYSKF